MEMHALLLFLLANTDLQFSITKIGALVFAFHTSVLSMHLYIQSGRSMTRQCGSNALRSWAWARLLICRYGLRVRHSPSAPPICPNRIWGSIASRAVPPSRQTLVAMSRLQWIKEVSNVSANDGNIFKRCTACPFTDALAAVWFVGDMQVRHILVQFIHQFLRCKRHGRHIVNATL